MPLPKSPFAPPDPESKRFRFEVAREWRMKHVNRWSDDVLLQQRADAISMQKHHADAPFRFNAVTAIISSLGGIVIDRVLKAAGAFVKLSPNRKALAEDAVLLGAGVGTAYLWGSHQKKMDDRRVELEAGLELDRYNEEVETRTGIPAEELGAKKINLQDLTRLRKAHSAKTYVETVAGDPTAGPGAGPGR